MITNFELKLGSVKETLSREQMKQISGGVQDPNFQTCWFESLDENGYAHYYYSECEGTSEYCQGYADAQCLNNDGCYDVDCS